MNVDLISYTPNILEVIYRAARTCYSAMTPRDMWNKVLRENLSEEELKGKMTFLIDKVLGSCHESIAEHAYFTFAVEGIDRATLAQITRHRTGIAFSVQSQRYVEIKESKKDLVKLLDNYDQAEIYTLVDKYFVVDREDHALQHTCLMSLINYRDLIENHGKKAEDARAVLPNCTKTNMIISMNLREFMHICNLRLCTKAQLPIRQMVQAMVKEVVKVEPAISKYLVPKCVSIGYCNESDSCGRVKVTKEDLLRLQK